MAVIEGYDRDGEEYVKFLEDEYCRHKKAGETKPPVDIDVAQMLDANRLAQLSGD